MVDQVGVHFVELGLEGEAEHEDFGAGGGGHCGGYSGAKNR